MNLFEITKTLYEIESALIEGRGEMTQDLEERFSSAVIAKEKKVDAYHAIIERCKSLEAEYKAKAELFDSIAKASINAAAKLKKSLKEAMAFLEVSELYGQDIRFSLVESKPKVVIEDEGLIPISFFKQETILKLDFDSIRDSWKQGMPVPGTKMENVSQLRTYAARKAK